MPIFVQISFSGLRPCNCTTNSSRFAQVLGRLKLGGNGGARENLGHPRGVHREEMKVTLGKLACSGVRTPRGDATPAGARRALFPSARKLKAGREPLAPPRFLADQGPMEAGGAVGHVYSQEVDALREQEALRQRTTVSQLAAHALRRSLVGLEFLLVTVRGDVA